MRLVNADRKDIVNKALAHRFDAEFAKIDADKESLIEVIYNKAFKKHDLEWAKKAPKGWLCTPGGFDVNLSGFRLRFEFKECASHPIPFENYYHAPSPVDDPALAEQYKANADAKIELQEKKNTLRDQLTAMLVRITTLAKLQETWPEGAPFYAHLKPKERIEVPALHIADINKLLNIDNG